MQDFDIVRKFTTDRTFRVDSVIGKFDLPNNETEFRISGQLPDVSEPWKIGAICGPSGTGKSAIAEELFKDSIIKPEWDGRSIVDNFKEDISMDQITGALSSVGFNSIPKWLLPYSALSNGQKFRADMARIICENEFSIVDEFTSVVDRIVAKSVSASISKFFKRTEGKRIILLSCHSDILEWLEPDWVFYTDEARLSRDCLRRPQFEITIVAGSPKQWPAFKDNHYLTGSISPSSRCYIAYFNSVAVGFFSTMPVMGMAGWDRGHRIVVLPDYQGLGIGNRMTEIIAEHLWTDRKRRFRITTSSMAFVKYWAKHTDKWKMIDGPAMKNKSGTGIKTSTGRLSTTWQYLPFELRQVSE